MSTPVGFDGQVMRVRGTDEQRAVQPQDVVWGGEIIGTDPDENVRLQLLRDAEIGSSGGGDPQ